METRLFGAYTLNEEIRKNSSSGGVFYSLAYSIIEKNGVVFGARFNKEWEVVHDFCETTEGITAFMGSKYVQSKIGNTYIKAKGFLEAGRKVLFSGTPCQIAGLKNFLGKEYENLLMVDMICHGVPSPQVWQIYLKELTNNKVKSISNINFRSKAEGWKEFSLEITGKENTLLIEKLNKNTYLKGFLQDLYLRPSCHNCAFKGIKRCSDITLADYWGVEKDCPSLFDDKGTSLLLVHTLKGKEELYKLKENLILKKVSKSALNYNSAALNSVKKPPNRDLFFIKHENEEIIPLIENLTKIRFSRRIVYGIKRIIKKIIR